MSGWRDEDKEGRLYREYFTDYEQYDVSNYGEDSERGAVVSGDSIPLDLTRPLPSGLIGLYDIVLNHTVLEHLPDPFFAFSQMAKLSRNLIISIVPFKQKLHFVDGGFHDYWRFTPFAMRELHDRNGFYVIYESFTPRPSLDVYLLTVGSRDPRSGMPSAKLDLSVLNQRLGDISTMQLLGNFVHRVAKHLRIV